MPKKIKTKTKTSAKLRSSPDRIDPRKKLLARVAGNIAGSLVGAPSPTISTADKIATVSVDIAEQILRMAGVPGASVPGVASAEVSSEAAS